MSIQSKNNKKFSDIFNKIKNFILRRKIISLVILLLILDPIFYCLLNQFKIIRLTTFPFKLFLIFFIDIFLIYLYFVFNVIYDSFKVNPLLSFIGILIWSYISSIVIFMKSNLMTFAFMDKFLVSLATIGTLLVAFIPQGLLAINEKYRPNGKKLYSEYELSKELTKIIYSLIIFVGIYIFNMLLGIFFPDQTPIFHYIIPKIHNGSTNIYKYTSVFYIEAFIVGISMLIYAFIKIISIAIYFYFYEMDFEKLKSIYKDFGNCELDWILKKKLFGYFVNKYEIKSPEILIDKFDIIAKDNPKYSNKKITELCT